LCEPNITLCPIEHSAKKVGGEGVQSDYTNDASLGHRSCNKNLKTRMAWKRLPRSGKEADREARGHTP